MTAEKNENDEQGEGQEPESGSQEVLKDSKMAVEGVDRDETPKDQLTRAAQNMEAEGEKEPSATVPLLSPQKDKIFKAKMYVIWRKDTGDIVAVWVHPVPLDLLTDKMAVHEISLGWTKPPWEKQTEYRQECQEWKPTGNVSILNRLRLHRLYLDHHLKEAEGLLDSEGGKIELKFSPEGSMTHETYEKVSGCDVSIVDTALLLYERDILKSAG